MDDFFFSQFVDECREVSEATSYVEVLNYSDSTYNSCEQHALTLDEFDNFLYRRGAFAPPEKMKYGNKLLGGMRLVVQMNAKHPDTFSPKVISLPKELYENMVRVMRLPMKSIETTAVVGPFFWSALDDSDEKDPHLHIVHRKSDVRKKGKTRGWEMMLSHSFRTSITTGYIKGTPSSEVVTTLTHLKHCTHQVSHPILLPTIFLAYDLGPANDQKQRDARDWVRRLENAVSLRDEVAEEETYSHQRDGGMIEIDGLSRDLVECHGHVMWKRPQAYTALVGEMGKAMEMFRLHWAFHGGAGDEQRRDGPGDGEAERRCRKDVEGVHRDILARLDFYLVKLKGLENYIFTTLERLKVQREALYNIMSQREARLNLEIAGEQRRIAHASKRDSTAMKTLSLLGALFLPGSFLASVFGMSFFNFEEKSQPVSVDLWIYFAVTVPITVLIVVSWMYVDRRRQEQHQREDADLEKSIDKMEKDIMFHLRKRTMSKAHTWNTVTSPPKAG